MTRNQVIKSIDAGRTDLSRLDLSYQDLSDLDLSGVNFRGADLRSVSLQSSILTDADLTGAKMTNGGAADAVPPNTIRSKRRTEMTKTNEAIRYGIATCTDWNAPDWGYWTKLHGPRHRTLQAAVDRDRAEQSRCHRESGMYLDQRVVAIENDDVRALSADELAAIVPS